MKTPEGHFQANHENRPFAGVPLRARRWYVVTPNKWKDLSWPPMMDPEKSLAEYRRRICLAVDFINRGLSENPSLDEIAEAAMFSKFHFHRIFHMLVGETVAGFTRRLKLERAANLLIYNRPLGVTDIAMDCGFSSSQNFAKAFRKHFSMTPSAYRLQFSKHGNTNRNEGNAPSPPLGYDAFLFGLNNVSFQRSKEMKVELKTMPDCHVAYARNIGPYGPEGCRAAHRRLERWAEPRGFIPGGLVIGVSWDNPSVTPPEKCRYDACVTVPEDARGEGEIATQVIPGGLCAMYRVRLSQDEFGRAWEQLMGEWLPQSGYQCDDRPTFEICLNDAETDPDHKWEVDICCPIKPL
ncbi:MAG: AraC family transcriptional regulator [Pseudomonadota bacterium]